MKLRMIRADQLDRYRKTGTHTLLDIRSPSEFEQYHIPGSRNAPYSEFDEWSKKLDPDRRYLILCERGARSIEICRFLRERGMEALSVAGGIQAYKNARGKRKFDP